MSKNKKKYQVYSKDGQHEYDIHVKTTEKGEKLSLHLSNGDQWYEDTKGTKQLTMLDTGDGIVFNKDLTSIGYDTLTHLRLLIGLERELDENPCNKEKYKLINGKTAIKL